MIQEDYPGRCRSGVIDLVLVSGQLDTGKKMRDKTETWSDNQHSPYPMKWEVGTFTLGKKLLDIALDEPL